MFVFSSSFDQNAHMVWLGVLQSTVTGQVCTMDTMVWLGRYTRFSHQGSPYLQEAIYMCVKPLKATCKILIMKVFR